MLLPIAISFVSFIAVIDFVAESKSKEENLFDIVIRGLVIFALAYIFKSMP